MEWFLSGDIEGLNFHPIAYYRKNSDSNLSTVQEHGLGQAYHA
jgi:hypothetical protein